MKKALAAVLAVTMTFGAAALPMTESGLIGRTGIRASAGGGFCDKEYNDDYSYGTSFPDKDKIVEGIIIEYIGSEKDIKLIDEIDGKPVEAIQYVNCKNAESVIIPRSVTHIIDNAIGYIFNNDTFEYAKKSNLKIYCYKDTAGEEYAIKNGFEYTILDTEKPVHTHTYETIKVIAPTYYADGYTIKKCSCGSEIKTDIVKKKVLGKTTAKTTFTATTNAVRVNWLKTPGATGYKIYRQDGKKWAEAGTVYNSNTTSFKVKGLKSGTTYKFRVKPFIKSGKKVTWGTASDTVTTSTVPAKAYIGHVAKSEKAIRFFWRKINAMGYQIQRYDYTAKKWKLIKTVRNNKTNNYRYIVPRKNTIYKFRIRAYTKVGKKTIFGKWSNSKIVMAK